MATTVALFARRSTDSAHEGLTIERQLADLRAFAAVRGWEVLEELEDPDLEAPSSDGRRVFEHARGLLRDGVVRGVIAWRLDLLVTDVAELQQILGDAVRSGGFVASVDDLVDTSHDAGRAIARAVAGLRVGGPVEALPVGGPAGAGLESLIEPVPQAGTDREPEGTPGPGQALTREEAPEPVPRTGEPLGPEEPPEPEEASDAEGIPELEPWTEEAPEPEEPPEAEPEEPPEAVLEPELGPEPPAMPPRARSRQPRPYGLTPDWSSIVLEEAEVIRECNRRILAGTTLRMLARRLNRRGIRTSTGGRWRAGQLGRTVTADHVAGMRVVRGLAVEDGVLPVIVPRSELEQVREALADRGWGPRGMRRHLLAGLVRCGRCGEPMFGRPRRGRARRYACGRPPQHRGCGSVRIAAAPTERLVEAAVLHALTLPGIVTALTTAAAYQVQPLPGLTAIVISPRETWRILTLDERRALMRLLVERVTVGRGRVGGSFDPSRVSIDWRI